jgi:hypothetical protein
MRMKDLVAKQKALYQLCAFFKPERLFDLWHEQSRERDLLRQSHRYAREQAKVGKAFVAEKKLEPEFWVDYPNHDGRRDTMLAVLKSKGLCTEHVTEVMPVYAKWLLTAKKTHADGRPMNRWALMTAWLDDTEI